MTAKRVLSLDARETFEIAESFTRNCLLLSQSHVGIWRLLIHRILMFLQRRAIPLAMTPDTAPGATEADALTIMIFRSLAVEYKLKCLILLDDRAVSPTNNQHKLFRSLKSETRDRIYKAFEIQMQQPSCVDLRRKYGPASVEDLLQATDDGFTHFHHVKQHLPGHTKDDKGAYAFHTQLIGYLVRNIILERHPEWITSRKLTH